MGRAVKALLFLALVVGVPLWLFLSPPGGGPDHLTAARDAIGRRDFATARRELDTHLGNNPRDLDAHLLAAQTARRADDGPAAEGHLQQYLDLGGDPDAVALERTLRRSQEGDSSGGGGALKFCTDNPDHPAVPFMLEALARGLLATGRPGQALTCLDLWLARSPPPADRVQALEWRGRALEGMGRAPEAAEDYRRALAIDPGHAEARLRLAGFLTRDDPREALAHYERLERDAPGRPEVLLGLARCRRQLGDHEAAGRILAGLTAARPDDVDVLTEAGALAVDRGRPAEAEGLLRKAVALAPDRRDPNLQLARCLHDLGKEAEAWEVSAKVKKLEEELLRRIGVDPGAP
ncbi:MAG: tetratricopeptide repeat protein [Gemmataceae bacterium]|nr:tetratricopeptide repeat protein [Gemmataceae bacterium]